MQPSTKRFIKDQSSLTLIPPELLQNKHEQTYDEHDNEDTTQMTHFC